jgi:MFS family permease
LGAIGVGSTAGRFFLGGLADRLGRAFSLLLMVGGMVLAFAVWLVSTSLWPLAAFALLFGLFYGGWVALMPAVVADYFPGRNIGGVLGILSLSIAVGTLIGPSAAGFAYDFSHSYTVPILASAASYVVAAAILALTSGPPRRQ